MKTGLVLALIGSAVAFVSTTFPKEKDTVDPQVAEQVRALAAKYEVAFNRSDAGGLSALYTDDAVMVTVHGTFHGREAIAKEYAERSFGQYECHNYVRKGDRANAVGNDVRATGKWTCAFHDTDGKNKHIDGHYSWIFVREGNSWKIRRDNTDEGSGY
jgi:uncharacterized protein (TIGR02246 family)